MYNIRHTYSLLNHFITPERLSMEYLKSPWVHKSISIFCIFLFVALLQADPINEKWSDHPEWLWFDDFENGSNLKTNYQDVDTSGFSVVSSDAFSGTHCLRQHYKTGQVGAGWIIRINDDGYPEHLFMRWYHKFESGFDGFPPKMARMRYRSHSDNWPAPLEIHCWIDNGFVVADAKSEYSSQTNATGWLPIAISNFTFNNSANIGRWVCFEMEVSLNTPGAKDGHYRIWADDTLLVERTNVDLRGTENVKINEVMLDCYWNGGSPKDQNRYYDNFVISTKRIGKAGANVATEVFNTKSQPQSILPGSSKSPYFLNTPTTNKSLRHAYLLNGSRMNVQTQQNAFQIVYKSK